MKDTEHSLQMLTLESMENRRTHEAFVLGAFLCFGLIVTGFLLSQAITRFKALERTVSVKGLSEKDVAADIAIWPVKFEVASDDLPSLVASIEEKNAAVLGFLRKNGFDDRDISVSAPSITDRQAQNFGEGNRFSMRYAGSSTISVYTKNVDLVRETIKKMVELGKMGIAISGQNYESKTEFLFTGLNTLKPAMIEEATNNARMVAQKFATDSKSRLGKIKSAAQGQFTIEDRDSNTPYIKKVRVVSTIEYYLSD